MADKEPVVGKLFRQVTADAHDLRLQPDAGNQSFAPDIIGDFLDAFREAFVALLPLADAVPPVAVGVPAGVDTEVLAASLGSSVHQRIFLSGGGTAPETVHIIVENDGQFFIVLIFSADFSAVVRERAHGIVEANAGDTDGGRNGGEALAGL